MMTAYTINQLLKFKGKHEIEIIVIDNNSGDGSVKYFKPFIDDIKYYTYPKNMLQSHGIAFDYVLWKGIVSNDYFITIESDSFPTQDNWLDYYENLVNQNFDCAASILQLSGGSYGHPAGALYKKSAWQESKKYCDSIPYSYFPNMSMKEGFACHLMVHNSIKGNFLNEPEDYIILADGYKPYSSNLALEKQAYYLPVVQPFHNGMGMAEESVKTYGQRNIDTEWHQILLGDKPKLINRIGYEPGQWLFYWMLAMDKKVFHIPTEVKWLDGKENQQQEYTINEVGFKHWWGISAYHNHTPQGSEDIAKIKQSIPEQLYETLPDNQKIK